VPVAFLPAAAAIPATFPIIPFFVVVFLLTTVVVLTEDEALLLLAARCRIGSDACDMAGAATGLRRTVPTIVVVEVVEALVGTRCLVERGFSAGGPMTPVVGLMGEGGRPR
jgi:hypothetical protein